MNFIELNKDDFQAYASQHPLRTFLQTKNMGDFQDERGQHIYYLGVMDNEQIVAAGVFFGKKTHFGIYYSCPCGFLMDYQNTALLSYYTKYLHQFLKQKDGYILNIEPEILYQERDINGDIVKDGFNHQEIVNNLISCGYSHNGFYIELDLSKQVRWSFVLEYKDYTLDQLFNNFKSTTRNLIRKAIKHQVKVRELDYDELHLFKDVVDSTGERRHFECRPLSYYQSMYKHFHQDGYLKFLVATLNLEDHLQTIETEINETQAKIDKLPDTPKSKGKLKEYQEALTGLLKKQKEAQSMMKKHGKDIILAGGMFIYYGNESIYLYSGSYQEFMSFSGQHLIQWEVIQQSYQMGLKKHNFYGISGDFSKSNKRWGVYEFKRGFDGVVYEYIGDFDYILKPIHYQLSQLNKKLRG